MGISLKAARVNAGFTQVEAAKAINVDVSTLSRYERGLSKPDVSLAGRMSDLYGCSMNDIIFCPKSTIKPVKR